ncbi:hypothetical protein FA95DRAFT_1565979 [Auriscalpium vulgare]|uniref:Uncharacterized protein n=1 Tax=Auriscalpium vulgare TaxID=40419 RepID=A0ACB8RAU3_9AGAM|nr:hypothetical protein FA95DRAFT_1565979 [Auriscalpium vulgare]
MVGRAVKHWIRRLPIFSRRHRPSTRPSSETDVLAQAQESSDDTQPKFQETEEQAAVRRAHAEHNALQPICRLPPELLGIIFACVAAKDLPYRGHLGWITLTFTCHHFRRIALAQTTIWANIPLTLSSEWRQLMLVRSQDAPLTIEIFYRGSLEALFAVRPTDLDFIFSNLHRTDTLRLFTSFYTNQRLLDDFVGHPAPILQRLEAIIRPNYNLHFPFQFPPHFLGDAAPRLRHLALTTASRRPWEIPFTQGLTSLEMTYEYEMPRMPPLGELLDALDGMAQLTKLRLDISNPPLAVEPNPGDRGVSVAPQRIVTLPNLTQMYLRTRLVRGADLLRHVTLPPSIPLHIIIDYWGEHEHAVFDHEFSAYLALPRAPFAKLVIAPPLLDIDAEDHSSTADVAIEVSAWHANAPGGSSPDFLLILNVFDLEDKPPAVSFAAMCAFASPNLQALTIAEDSWKKNATWPLTGSGSLAGLRTLEVSGHAANALARELANNPAEEFLPALTALTLHNLTVEPMSDSEAHITTAFRHPGYVGLPDWLAARKEAGRSVQLTMDVDIAEVDLRQSRLKW